MGTLVLKEERVSQDKTNKRKSPCVCVRERESRVTYFMNGHTCCEEDLRM